MRKYSNDVLDGIVIELRKIMLVRDIEFREVRSGMYGLFSKFGEEMEEPLSLKEWGERLIEHKEYISGKEANCE